MELKPCPFCGSADVRVWHKQVVCEMKKHKTVSDRYKIYCGNCPGETGKAFYLEDAITAWNRRAANV